jgi:hypothetical protein
LTNDEWETLAERIFEIVALETWDELTQIKLGTYLTVLQRKARALQPLDG